MLKVFLVYHFIFSQHIKYLTETKSKLTKGIKQVGILTKTKELIIVVRDSIQHAVGMCKMSA